jgi:hypothetical protein
MNCLFKQTILLSVLSLILASCSTKKENIANLADNNGFHRSLVEGAGFQITTYQKINSPSEEYVFYIEGDGRPFIRNQFISDDPTPYTQTLFNLLTSDHRPNIIYLGRPCQYTDKELNPKCNNNKYWTDWRMNPETVASLKEVIQKIAGNNNYNLVGFSGGGGMAVLIANHNPKVKSIITIAGNLDIVAFNKYHNVRPSLPGLSKIPMEGSLNPIDYASNVKYIPQLHLSGGKDTIVPALIADNFVTKSNSKCVKQEIIPEASHTQNWKDAWQTTLHQVPIKCTN